MSRRYKQIIGLGSERLEGKSLAIMASRDPVIFVSREIQAVVSCKLERSGSSRWYQGYTRYRCRRILLAGPKWTRTVIV